MDYLFQILDIEATDDIDVVKRAYYKKLQTTDEADTIVMAQLHDACQKLIRILTQQSITNAEMQSTINQFNFENIIEPDALRDVTIYKDVPYTKEITLATDDIITDISNDSDLIRLAHEITSSVSKYAHKEHWDQFMKQINAFHLSLNMHAQVLFRSQLSAMLRDSQLLIFPELTEALLIFYALDKLYAFEFISREELIDFSKPSLLITRKKKIRCSDGTCILIYKKTTTTNGRRFLISMLVPCLLFGALIIFGATYKNDPHSIENLEAPISILNSEKLYAAYSSIEYPRFDKYSDESKAEIKSLQDELLSMNLITPKSSFQERNLYKQKLDQLREAINSAYRQSIKKNSETQANT